jgi:hypothetical protein
VALLMVWQTAASAGRSSIPDATSRIHARPDLEAACDALDTADVPPGPGDPEDRPDRL